MMFATQVCKAGKNLQSQPLHRWAFRVPAVLLLGILLAAPSPAAQSKAAAVAEGKLALNNAGMPVLKTREGVKELTTANSYLLHTLKDQRLQGRDVR